MIGFWLSFSPKSHAIDWKNRSSTLYARVGFCIAWLGHVGSLFSIIYFALYQAERMPSVVARGGEPPINVELVLSGEHEQINQDPSEAEVPKVVAPKRNALPDEEHTKPSELGPTKPILHDTSLPSAQTELQPESLVIPAVKRTDTNEQKTNTNEKLKRIVQVKAQQSVKESVHFRLKQAQSQASTRASTQGRSKTAGLANLTAFRSHVIAHLLKFKRYPEQARSAELEGGVRVAFTLNSRGTVRSATIEKTSGVRVLDQETLRMIYRAQPYPDLPGGATKMDFHVLIHYTLES